MASWHYKGVEFPSGVTTVPDSGADGHDPAREVQAGHHACRETARANRARPEVHIIRRGGRTYTASGGRVKGFEGHAAAPYSSDYLARAERDPCDIKAVRTGKRSIRALTFLSPPGPSIAEVGNARVRGTCYTDPAAAVAVT